MNCLHSIQNLFVLIPIVLLNLRFDRIVILLINGVRIEHLLIEVHSRILSDGVFLFLLPDSFFSIYQNLTEEQQ